MKPETRQRFIIAAYENTVLKLPAETSHALVERVLRIKPVQNLLKQEFGSPAPKKAAINIKGREFPVFSIAAGLDKKGNMSALTCLSASGIEFGGFTLEPRSGNPKLKIVNLKGRRVLSVGRIIRDKNEKVALNYMGFPNPGIYAAAQNIQKGKKQFPDIKFGINVPPTPGEKDFAKVKDDLTKVIYTTLSLNPDWITFNPFCPNNNDSNHYQKTEVILELMDHLSQFINDDSPPFFIKIGPDMAEGNIRAIVTACKLLGFTGIIGVNSSVDYTNQAEVYAGYPGGYTGKILKVKMLRAVKLVRQFDQGFNRRRLVIGAVGGIADWEDWQEAKSAGADFCQILTGFIFNPYVFQRLSRQESETQTLR